MINIVWAICWMMVSLVKKEFRNGFMLWEINNFDDLKYLQIYNIYILKYNI